MIQWRVGFGDSENVEELSQRPYYIEVCGSLVTTQALVFQVKNAKPE